MLNTTDQNSMILLFDDEMVFPITYLAATELLLYILIVRGLM